MSQYTYILVNFFTIIICFVFSFDKRIQFHLYFKSYLKAAVLVGIPFILWDVWFTYEGVWWFNNTYLIGVRFLGLPIEEWIFFLCIPFSCTFTYYCLNKFFNLTWMNAFNTLIVFVTSIVCLVVALLHYDKIYTLVTALCTAITILYFQFVNKSNFIGQASLVYTILMLGFFPVNGVLTGTGLENPIVNYNPNEFLSIRMGTIPIEDAVYGYTQFLWIVFFFNKWGKSDIIEGERSI